MRVIAQEVALQRSEGHHYHHFIHELPTFDAVPVVHGRWEYSSGSYCTPKCSCCGWCIPYSEDSRLDARNFCPNCGAKMDGGAT